MADKKAPVIVIKKKKGGHAGAHGGAWKVAYADFVTAMMAFFMVMWLLGSDEEIKASVAHYFNNPTSAWRPDIASKEMLPLGEFTGAGENMLKGNEGQTPDDLVDRPSRPYIQSPQRPAQTSDLLEDALGEDDTVFNVESLALSLSEAQLFKRGTDELSPEGERHMKKFNRMVKGFKGKLTLYGYTDPKPESSGDPYEFAVSRLVSIKNYFLNNKLIDDERIKAKVHEAKVNSGVQERRPASERKIDLLFTDTPGASNSQ